MANKTLSDARVGKNDEFYTQMNDINDELRHYKSHFVGATVFCNCDDPYESNFFKYFALNFNRLGLKKLIATCYCGSPITGNELLIDFGDGTTPKKLAYKVEITEVGDTNGDGAYDLADVRNLLQYSERNVLSQLCGDDHFSAGDFRSKECVRLLDEADIVVTNPPFSLFREYIALLMDWNKKFLVIGNMNAITYKEFFPLIQENKVWIGYDFNKSMVFQTQYENISESNQKAVRAKGYDPTKGFIITPAVAWYTNLDIEKRHENLLPFLYKHYTPEEFPKYDNYDAIEVSRVADIPVDYMGMMGVPITFLDKYNPNEFDIIGLDRYTVPPEFLVGGRVALNGKPRYARILIQRKNK